MTTHDHGGRGKRESCRKFFSTHLCVCSTFRHPSCSLFGARGVLGGGKETRGHSGCIPRRGRLGPVCGEPRSTPCLCQHLSDRQLAARVGASGRGRGCPSRRRRPSPAPAAARGRAAEPPPLACRALRPGSAHGPLLPTAAGWGKVDKGRGQAGALGRRPSLSTPCRDAARSPEVCVEPEAWGEGTGNDRSPAVTPSCRISLGFEERGTHSNKGGTIPKHLDWHRKEEKEHLKGVQDPQHERIITVSTNGSIHSPRFPHTYPRNMVLVWRLVAAEENVWIQLTFDERFGLEDPEDDICKYDFVEVEEPSDGTILGRWCGSGTVPGKQISKGNQIRIRFVSDEYFPSEPGFCIHYNIVVPFTEAVSPSVLPPSALPLDLLNNAVTAFSTLEDLIRYLEPDRWQLDLEDLYRPTWQLLGKAFVFGRKSRVVDLNLLKEEVRLYSCTPRNFSVSIREELKRTDTIFWPGCLLVKRCGGNCACCLHNCHECQCVPSKVTKKYHEVLQLRPKSGVRGLHKSLTDVALEHHEECDCVCRGHAGG
ncbi:platelet-derived growth factor C isoform X3 [Callorhinus ursinus]|uniref:platelet-derived growth factor C isoform X3 n=1 Tax=Callorhinus ursinus TaxID=34884 RepID=UPI003CD0160B